MKKQWKRAISVILCAVMLCGAAVLPAHAAAEPDEQPSALMRLLYNAGDAAIRAVARGLGNILYTNLPRKYTQDPAFLPGMDAFLSEPAQDAIWSVGYASASLIPDGLFAATPDPETGWRAYIGPDDVFVGGQIVPFGLKNPTWLVDDQRVRVTAMDDGSGRGAVVFASIDAYAITAHDVRAIRKVALELAGAKDLEIASINVSAMHQHSVIDTLGMNGPLIKSIFLNNFRILFGCRPFSGKNKDFMENLHITTARKMIEAVEGMEEGKLFYSEVDGAALEQDFTGDGRYPDVRDTKLRRFRFVPMEGGLPKEGAKETWLVNMAAHCTMLGAGPTTVSGDYPYYIEQAIGEDANFQLIQGAQLDIGTYTRWTPEEEALLTDQYMRCEAYGARIAGLLNGMGGGGEVAPLLNVRHGEYHMQVQNPLHLLLFLSGMIDAVGYRRNLIGHALNLVTETGYMEIGDDLAVVFGPGEIDPILVKGGGMGANEAWTGKDYAFTPMGQMVRGGRDLMTFGLTNDHSGYYLVPNDFKNFLLPGGNEEINTVNPEAATYLLQTFKSLTDWAKAP